MNLLKQFRAKLGLSRPQLAALLTRSKEIVERYESEVPPDLARELAALAKQHNLPEWERRWLVESGDQRDERNIDLSKLSEQEHELASILIGVLRDPDPDSFLEKNLPQLLHDMDEHRKRYFQQGKNP